MAAEGCKVGGFASAHSCVGQDCFRRNADIASVACECLAFAFVVADFMYLRKDENCFSVVFARCRGWVNRVAVSKPIIIYDTHIDTYKYTPVFYNKRSRCALHIVSFNLIY